MSIGRRLVCGNILIVYTFVIFKPLLSTVRHVKIYFVYGTLCCALSMSCFYPVYVVIVACLNVNYVSNVFIL